MHGKCGAAESRDEEKQRRHSSISPSFPPSLPPSLLAHLHEGLLPQLLLDSVRIGLVEKEGGNGDVRAAAVVRHDLQVEDERATKEGGGERGREGEVSGLMEEDGQSVPLVAHTNGAYSPSLSPYPLPSLSLSLPASLPPFLQARCPGKWCRGPGDSSSPCTHTGCLQPARLKRRRAGRVAPGKEGGRERGEEGRKGVREGGRKRRKRLSRYVDG